MPSQFPDDSTPPSPGIVEGRLTATSGTPVTTAIEMGSQIGKELAEARVDGVLLVAT